MKVFKYSGVLFTTKGKMEIDMWMYDALALMQTLSRTVMVKGELSLKSNLLIYWLIYIPTLTYGHELLVIAKRMRSWI